MPAEDADVSASAAHLNILLMASQAQPLFNR